MLLCGGGVKFGVCVPRLLCLCSISEAADRPLKTELSQSLPILVAYVYTYWIYSDSET